MINQKLQIHSNIVKIKLLYFIMNQRNDVLLCRIS